MQRLCHRLQYSSIACAVSSNALLYCVHPTFLITHWSCVFSKTCLWNFFRRLLAKQNRLTMMRNAVWALSNLCRGKNPPPDFTKVIWLYKCTAMATAHFSQVYHISLQSIVCIKVLLSNIKTHKGSFLPHLIAPFICPPRCLHVLVFCLGYCLSMTQTSWLMHAGHCPTYLMDQMTKSRQWLTPEFVAGWWSCWCKTLNWCITSCFVEEEV